MQSGRTRGKIGLLALILGSTQMFGMQCLCDCTVSYTRPVNQVQQLPQAAQQSAVAPTPQTMQNVPQPEAPVALRLTLPVRADEPANIPGSVPVA